MKTGWIISVEDKKNSDKAFKCVIESRLEAAERVRSLCKKHEELIAEGSFSVAITAPHSEIDPSKRQLVKRAILNGHSAPLSFSELHDLNPFCIKISKTEAIFEIDTCDKLPNNSYSLVIQQ